MKKIDLGQTIAILANLGVLAGLIFVGVQLWQDRELAALTNINAAENNRKYWAELINSNADVWVKGVSCESLTASEEAGFDALAAAWEMQNFTVWYQSTQLAGPRTPESFAIEAADFLVRNPGLLAWWQNYQESFADLERQIGRQTDDSWSRAVNEKITQLADGSLPQCE